MDCSQYLQLGCVAHYPGVLHGHLRPNTGDGEGQRTWQERARARSDRCARGVSGAVPIETYGEVFPHSSAVDDDTQRRSWGNPPQDTSLSGASSFSVDSSSFARGTKPAKASPCTLGCCGTGMEVRLISVCKQMDDQCSP